MGGWMDGQVRETVDSWNAKFIQALIDQSPIERKMADMNVRSEQSRLVYQQYRDRRQTITAH
jgi:alkylation response protein AidB-like acyl-CoA dehydrogenase